jgi:hypothetical protein
MSMKNWCHLKKDKVGEKGKLQDKTSKLRKALEFDSEVKDLLEKTQRLTQRPKKQPAQQDYKSEESVEGQA